MTEIYLQMVSALAAVVGLIFLMGFFLRKRQRKAGLMNVLAYQSFGPRKGIAAMKIGREILLVGVTTSDIKLLKAFDENDIETDTVREISDKVKRLRNIKEHLNENN
ncbi:MAG TPA: flagellar biosynthetic protein FliO [Thermodesulfovibrionales bacterium]|jgi:flagellar biogenesis protein FliO|nr:flagellar biosynthetic protein FliO [Thermodesulfovibrionales bacterium]